MSLDEFQELKVWHQRHVHDQPVEKHVWDTVVTLWIAGWVGIPTALLIHAGWALAACGAVYFLPGAYVRARRRLALTGRLRCDWIGVLPR